MKSLILALGLLGQINDSSFEQVKTTGYSYAPTGSTWTFIGYSGIQANGSAWSAPTAPNGAQTAFLQQTGIIQQTINITTPDTYGVLFFASQRGNQQEDFNVVIDDNVVSTLKPGVGFKKYISNMIPLSIGNHTLKFVGLNTVGGDNSAFLDNISLTNDPDSLATSKYKNAWVGSSGKVIGIQYDSIITSVNIIPSLSVNGINLGQLQKPWITGYHNAIFYATPNNYQIRPSDTVKLSAPLGWSSNSLGTNGSIKNAQLANKTNQPLFNTPNTLRIGINNNQAPYSTNLGYYCPTQNFAYRAGWGPGNRGKIIPGNITILLSDPTINNGIDNKQYPGISGLWLVMWDGPSTFGLSSSKATVTERVDLKVVNSIGNIRVFDIQPNATTAFDVNLTCNVTTYDKLWVVRPGDWDPNIPLDRSDPLAISPTYLKRIGNNVGSMRWVDSTLTGGNPGSFPYPEDMPLASNLNWGDLAFNKSIIGYTNIAPSKEPYIYSPFFPSYPGTLNADITTTPAVDTKEIWNISSDVLMVGLEVKIDDEIVRIINPSGTNWIVNRGSNGTTPATHKAGPINISGRMSTNGRLSNAIGLTTSVPHRITTGNSMNMSGSGWLNMPMTDGKSINLNAFGRPVYVTGPNTFYFSINTANITQSYDLNPATQYCDQRYGGGIPIDAAAIMTGKFPKANFHVNVPIDASTDLVYKIARLVKANFPIGRKVIVEYGNEPWNWGFGAFYYHSGLMGPLVVPGNPYQLAHYAWRAAQVHKIFREIFAERSGEIVGIVNCQMGSDPTQYLMTGIAANSPFDAVAIAPYYRLEPTPLNVSVANNYDNEQLIDMLTHDLWYNSRSMNGWVSPKNAINAYNAKNNKNCFLYGYEGGVEFVDPRGSTNITNAEVRSRSCIYNKNFYYHEMDFYSWLNYVGFQGFNVYSNSQWWNPEGWGLYHSLNQLPGYGDGLNGGKLNQGYTDFNDSVRGQAFLDYNNNLNN